MLHIILMLIIQTNMQKIFSNKNSSFFSKSSIYKAAFYKQFFYSSCLIALPSGISYHKNQLRLPQTAAKLCIAKQVSHSQTLHGKSSYLKTCKIKNFKAVYTCMQACLPLSTKSNIKLCIEKQMYTTFVNKTFTNISLQKSCKSLNNDRITLGHNTLKLKTSWHNNLNKYYLGSKNNSMIFKNEFTYIYLIKALQVFASILQFNGNILIINTNPELSKLIFHVKKNIKNTQISFSDCGWTKGTLTNWGKVFNKVKTFIDFHQDYNKFLNENNIHFPNYKKMKKNYKGFSRELDSKWKPDLLIFTNSNNIESILKEASILKIPTIAFIDSNSNIYDVTYPIPGNTYFYPITRLFFTLIAKIANKITYKTSKN